MTHSGAGGGKNPLKFHGGDDVWMSCVAIGIKSGRIKSLKTGGEDDGTHI